MVEYVAKVMVCADVHQAGWEHVAWRSVQKASMVITACSLVSVLMKIIFAIRFMAVSVKLVMEETDAKQDCLDRAFIKWKMMQLRVQVLWEESL